MSRAWLSVFRFLAKTNLFISIGSFFAVMGAFAFVGLELDYSLASFVFFASLFTYNFQRRMGDLGLDQSYSSIGLAMMVIGIMGMGFYVFELAMHQLVVLGFTGLISLAYAYPFIPSSRGKISLRLVPGVKLWAIVVVWTISCVILPVAYAGLFAATIVLFTLQQSCFVVALTIPFDIRDLPADWPEQRTLPQVFGVRKAKNIAIFFLLFSAFTSVLLFLLQEIDLHFILAHLGVLLISGGLISGVKAKKDELYYSIGIDGMLILQGAVFLLAKYFV